MKQQNWCMTETIQFSPIHRLVIRNIRCAYCGVSLDAHSGGEAEHVIGRRFVPKGALAAQWNLILRACPACNDAKADLEDDISAITMQPDAYGRFAIDDPRLPAEAERKGRTRNRRTSRRVSEPTPPLVINGNFGSATMRFSFQSPAQADERRLFDLARYQLTGFFYMLTYKEEERHGRYWRGVYAPVVSARREDWGHPWLRWIESVAEGWDFRLHAIAADGFYKIWIRKHPAADMWAWAIEWNGNYRLAGFFGDEQIIRDLFAERPQLDVTTLHEAPGEMLRYRRETPLADADDRLFEMPSTI